MSLNKTLFKSTNAPIYLGNFTLNMNGQSETNKKVKGKFIIHTQERGSRKEGVREAVKHVPVRLPETEDIASAK